MERLESKMLSASDSDPAVAEWRYEKWRVEKT
jgi:hypothetical protein